MINSINTYAVTFNVNMGKINQRAKTVTVKTLDEVLDIFHERTFNTRYADQTFTVVHVEKSRNSTVTETWNYEQVMARYENRVNAEENKPQESNEPTSWHCEIDGVVTETGNVAVNWPIPALQNEMRFLRMPVTMDEAYTRAINCYDLFSRLGISANIRLLSNFQL